MGMCGPSKPEEAVGPTLEELIESELTALATVVPRVHAHAIISPNGGVVFAEPSGRLGGPSVVNLQSSALHFANTLNQDECRVVHVKGRQKMLSCYLVGDDMDHILAFCSRFGSEKQLLEFDIGALDKRVQPILDKLCDCWVTIENPLTTDRKRKSSKG